MSIEDIRSIRKEIREKDLKWSAGKTTLSELSEEEKAMYLGLVIKEDEIREMEAALLEEDTLAAGEGTGSPYPTSWDWRDVYDRNWTTPVKDQGLCRSCTAFAVAAAVESNAKIFKKTWQWNPDLSEADLFFCGRGKGGCAQGWGIHSALTYAQEKGIPGEPCFPYTPKNQDCKPCSDRTKKIIKIQNWRKLCSVSSVKDWISKVGPVITMMRIYMDFHYYRGGVYKHAWGEELGLHTIAVVGYDDEKGYWICKNSWGEGWGERGWFRIAYGECNIGTSFCFFTVEFPTLSDDIYLPVRGKVTATLMSRESTFDNDVMLYKPQSKLLFKATTSNVGKTYDVGTFSAGQQLVFALKTPEGFMYFTNHSLNADCCSHVIRVPAGLYTWDLRWEDLYGLGDKDYNDVVLRIEVNPV